MGDCSINVGTASSLRTYLSIILNTGRMSDKLSSTFAFVLRLNTYPRNKKRKIHKKKKKCREKALISRRARERNIYLERD